MLQPLYKAALIGDSGAVQKAARKLARDLPDCEPFVRTVIQLAKDFHMDKLITLLETQIDSRSTS